MKTYILSFPDVTTLSFTRKATQKTARENSIERDIVRSQHSDGKRQNRSQEKVLLIILTCIYWIVALAICWFSIDSVLQYLMQTLFQIDMLNFQKP